MSGKRKRSIPKAVRSAVIKRDDYACTKCGAKRKSLRMHHRIMESRGGGETMENLVSVCQDCHVEIHRELRAKENKLYRERLEWTRHIEGARK